MGRRRADRRRGTAESWRRRRLDPPVDLDERLPRPRCADGRRPRTSSTPARSTRQCRRATRTTRRASCVLNSAASRSLSCGQPARSMLGGEPFVAVEAEALQQLGVELRLDRTDRDERAVGGTRTRRRSGRRCRAGWCRGAARRRHRSRAASRTSTSAAPYRRPSPRRRPGPSRCAAPPSSAHTTPKARNIAPPP